MKVFKSTDFIWSKLGGEADICNLVKGATLPKEFYIEDYHKKPRDTSFMLKFVLDDIIMDLNDPTVISEWRYKVPVLSGRFTQYSGAEITIFNL